MRKHRRMAMLAAGVAFAAFLSGCAKSPEETPATQQAQNTDSIQVMSTIFPQYDWIRQIVGEEDTIENTYLLNSGTDLHSFQPTTKDITNILSSDLFVYVGGESDVWVEDVLAQAEGTQLKAVNLMEVLKESLHEEELSEGMQTEEEGSEEEGTAYDEHVWLSLKNAKTICDYLAKTLTELDPEHEQQYADNLSAYEAKLEELDGEYAQVVQEETYPAIVVGDRFPFRYLVEDYGIAYYAAFPGCSADTEASFDTVVSLAKQVDENQLPAVLVTESSDQSLAKTIISNTQSKDQEILVLNSLQSVTSEQAKELTYLDVMKENLQVLTQALEGRGQ